MLTLTLKGARQGKHFHSQNPRRETSPTVEGDQTFLRLQNSSMTIFTSKQIGMLAFIMHFITFVSV